MTNEVIIKLIYFYSSIYGVDPIVAKNVAIVESSMNIKAIGEKGEIGLFQLMPSSFPEYSKKQLKTPELNIKLGIEHIAYSKKNCKHQKNLDYLACYNLGVNAGSKIKHPHLWKYVKKVNKLVRKEKKNEKRKYYELEKIQYYLSEG